MLQTSPGWRPAIRGFRRVLGRRSQRLSRDWPAQEAEEPLRLWKACILFIARALRGPASGLGPTLGEILGAFDLR